MGPGPWEDSVFSLEAVYSNKAEIIVGIGDSHKTTWTVFHKDKQTK